MSARAGPTWLLPTVADTLPRRSTLPPSAPLAGGSSANQPSRSSRRLSDHTVSTQQEHGSRAKQAPALATRRASQG